MLVVAIIAARNEELYLHRCLIHLKSQNIKACIINHGSIDKTRAIAENFLSSCVIRIVDMNYTGYDLYALLKLKESLASELDGDWFIHHDADEIMEAPSGYGSLYDGICAVDAAGCNLINFDEFVFVPTSASDCFENKDYVDAMKYYYFFQPHPYRLIRCWKRSEHLNIADSAGHGISISNPKLFTENFVLRHYTFLSSRHAVIKYRHNRKYVPSAVARGWHGWRARFNEEMLRLPNKEELSMVDGSGIWDKRNPQTHPMFIVEQCL